MKILFKGLIVIISLLISFLIFIIFSQNLYNNKKEISPEVKKDIIRNHYYADIEKSNLSSNQTQYHF